jgi:hypothetical protein
MSTPESPATLIAAEFGRAVRGAEVRQAMEAAALWLELQAPSVNALNVFPVPDGDTGTNMSKTMRAAADAVVGLTSDDAGAMTRAAARGALMGARGNSGVILSQILRGFADSTGDKPELTPLDIAAGLERAAQSGYESVSKPVEGTILTVARRVGEAAIEAADSVHTVSKLFEHALREADDAVRETEFQLETLRNAGVVDAGGQGYRLIIEAFWRVACGKPIDASEVPDQNVEHVLTGRADELVEEGFGFCTQYLMSNVDQSLEQVREFMNGVCDSVVVVGDSSLMRIHVHTLQPGQALDFGVTHGTVSDISIQNMQLQFEDATATEEPVAQAGTIGVVAVVPGPGFRNLFAGLGATGLVDGGQTMNPSVQDILAAVSKTGRDEVVILPNNGNILLAAQRAAEQSDLSIRVIPTRHAPQGVAAMLSYNFEGDLDSNVEQMSAAIASVDTIEITRAVREAQVEGFQVQRGQCLALVNDKMAAVTESFGDAVLAALKHCAAASRDLVTVYVGADVRQEYVDDLVAQIRAAFPNIEVEVAAGGQPHYPYILSIE